jgi:hypothetical protein
VLRSTWATWASLTGAACRDAVPAELVPSGEDFQGADAVPANLGEQVERSGGSGC